MRGRCVKMHDLKRAARHHSTAVILFAVTREKFGTQSKSIVGHCAPQSDMVAFDLCTKSDGCGVTVYIDLLVRPLCCSSARSFWIPGNLSARLPVGLRPEFPAGVVRAEIREERVGAE